MAEARKAVRNQPNPTEWGTPVLYLRAPTDASSTSRRRCRRTTPATGRTRVDELPPATEDPDFVAAQDQARAGRWDEVVRLLSR